MPRKTLVEQTHANRQTFLASMRPRPDAAENIYKGLKSIAGDRFNEAAARCRGKR